MAQDRFSKCRTETAGFQFEKISACLSPFYNNPKFIRVALPFTPHALPHDSVCSNQHVRRNRQTDLLRGF